MKLENKEYTYLVNFLEDTYDLVEYRLITESATIIDWTSANVQVLGNGYFAVNLSLGLFKGVIEWRGQLGGVYVDFAKEEVNTNEDFTINIDEIKTIVELIKDVETGNWRIIDSQMIFYKPDNTELFRVDLLQADGTPATATTATQRVRVA